MRDLTTNLGTFAAAGVILVAAVAAASWLRGDGEESPVFDSANGAGPAAEVETAIFALG